MNNHHYLLADAGGIIGAAILILLCALFIAAAWKFITGKKPGRLDTGEKPETKELPTEIGEEEKPEPGEEIQPEPEAVPVKKPPKAKPETRETEVVSVEKAAEKAPPQIPEKRLETKPPAIAPEPVPAGKPAAPPPPLPKPKQLSEGLQKTRDGLIARINFTLFGGKKAVEQVREELEEILFTADLGVKTSQKLLAVVESQLSGKELRSPTVVREALKNEITEILNLEKRSFDFTKSKPFVIMMVGVNGVGKTTTIGKIGAKLTEQKLSVIMASGDTFRAAATEQLEIWGKRSKAQVIRGQEGGDPAAVVYDAISAAKSKGTDVVIADTAGRLHTKIPLMEELKKVKRVIGKASEGAPHEILLVVDANTGQNAISQAREFNEALGITGIILTKLDGTAKGGIIIGICDELKIPVRYIGIGEAVEDLREFDPKEFAEALFS